MNKQRNMPQSFGHCMFVALIVLAVSLTGCQNGNEIIEDDGLAADRQSEVDSPQKSYFDNENNTNPPAAEVPDQEASTETSGAQKDGEQQKDDREAEASAWDSGHPKLYGISIGDNSGTIADRFGQESDRYSLEEEAGTIQVLEYDGFSIGLNERNKVQFVEVYEPQIRAGLSGLRIGDKPEKAVGELGKPESESEYLLIYNAEGATLKLDVNPDSNEIVSIKLLAQG